MMKQTGKTRVELNGEAQEPDDPRFVALKKATADLERELPGHKFCIIGAVQDTNATGFDTIALVSAGHQRVFMQALWDVVGAGPAELEEVLGFKGNAH